MCVVPRICPNYLIDTALRPKRLSLDYKEENSKRNACQKSVSDFKFV